MDLGSGVGQGQGMGKWAHSGKAEHSRAQASWTFTSFLITFVLPIRGADVITCWTELAGWLGNPVSGSQGPSLTPSGLDCPTSPPQGVQTLALAWGAGADSGAAWKAGWPCSFPRGPF